MTKNSPNITDLIYRSLIFDYKIYKIVKDKGEYTRYCLLIVIIAALASGISTAHFTSNISLIKQPVYSIIGWVVRSGIIYLIGVYILGYRSSISGVVRTLGLSYSPQILNLFAIIPFIGLNVFLISVIWLFFTTVFAVKQTFDCSRIMSLIITISGLFPYVVIMFFVIR